MYFASDTWNINLTTHTYCLHVGVILNLPDRYLFTFSSTNISQVWAEVVYTCSGGGRGEGVMAFPGPRSAHALHHSDSSLFSDSRPTVSTIYPANGHSWEVKRDNWRYNIISAPLAGAALSVCLKGTGEALRGAGLSRATRTLCSYHSGGPAEK